MLKPPPFNLKINVPTTLPAMGVADRQNLVLIYYFSDKLVILHHYDNLIFIQISVPLTTDKDDGKMVVVVITRMPLPTKNYHAILWRKPTDIY